jgi:predicted DNA-binding transcriptional regulator AlpA
MQSEQNRDRRQADRLRSITALCEDAAEPANSPSADYPQPIDPLLTDFDLEKLTGRARSSWQKARLTGDGPPFIRLGRLVRYRQSDFNAWLTAHARLRSTSEAGVVKKLFYSADIAAPLTAPARRPREPMIQETPRPAASGGAQIEGGSND